MTNPSVCEGGRYDTDEHIGPWTEWQGNLHAELMVVGQDWGGTDYYVKFQGRDKDNNPTNKNLIWLLQSIGIAIELPAACRTPGPLFFTNAVLCLKPGSLTGPVHPACFDNCGHIFLRSQIELVNPRVLVTLGLHAYQTVCKAYGLTPARLMREAVSREQLERLPGGPVLVPVYHPGTNGTLSRPLEAQRQDWKRARIALSEAGSTLCE